MSGSRPAPTSPPLLIGGKRFVWRHPEWWSLALSLVAWMAILVRMASGTRAAGSTSGGHHGHAGGSHLAWWAGSLDWLLMVVAMMVPLVVGPIRTTAARSLWARRHRAIGGFLVGYLAPWALLGLAVAVLLEGLAPVAWLARPATPAFAFAVAAGWQLTGIKRRTLVGCHRTRPLSPASWRADHDCVSYGWMIGWQCVLSCWGLMVACVLAGHGMFAMAFAGIAGALERFLPRADRRLVAAAMAGVALLYAARSL